MLPIMHGVTAKRAGFSAYFYTAEQSCGFGSGPFGLTGPGILIIFSNSGNGSDLFDPKNCIVYVFFALKSGFFRSWLTNIVVLLKKWFMSLTAAPKCNFFTSPSFKEGSGAGTGSESGMIWKGISARIFKRVWGPEIDSQEWIPPAYVAWRAGTITLFLLGS
jgi:hypothetical protein